ncbi:MAG: poly-gamma-glutamate hydrolase family protein [Chloroflexi bacterium]|nr:poly-gamma-glutamate hydrolase family protein [Chloroflexota bacterium]
MPDKYRNFQELQQDLQVEVEYRIREQLRLQATAILAIHGGGIEMGTSELASAIAGNEFSLYLFEGLAGNNQFLHITSTNFDEPLCLQFVGKHCTALSVHGFAGLQTDPLVYLGGNDLPLVQRLLEALQTNGYTARVNTGKFAATDPANICNRTSTGQGVQLELSAALRSRFFQDYSSYRGRQTSTPQFAHFVQVIRHSLLNI